MSTDDFTKMAAVVGAAFSPMMRWLVMKKDQDLPWVVRIVRWAAAILGIAYAAGFVAKSFVEWFG